jgi:hypothetical protein
MSSHRAAEDVKQRHIEVMGDDLGPLYHSLWNELAWVYSKWGEYVQLFGVKPSRIDLLNDAAAHFFRIVQDSLWEDTLLHIARLTDPPKSAGKDNLTIKRLPQSIEEKSLETRVLNLIDVAVDKAHFCRDWRNRRLAHRDLSLALSSGAEPLVAASRLKVKEALESMSDVLNAVSNHYLDSTTMFEGVGGHGSAESLLYVLDDGLRVERERQERVNKGDYRAGDYQARDL